jgi:antitoxin YefM
MPNNYTYSKARANLAKILDKVVNDNEVVYINRRKGDEVALISGNELSSMMETLYLLRTPANAKRLLKSLADSKKGRIKLMNVEEAKIKLGLEKK